MSFYDDASLIMFPSGYKEDKIYSLKPTDGSGDLTFTRASTATRVNEQGLIENAFVLGSELIPTQATIVNLGGGTITQILGNSYSSTSNGASGSTLRPKFDVALTIGKKYKLIITPIGSISGVINFDLYDGTSYVFNDYDFTTVKEVIFTANASSIFLAFDGTKIYSISNFTISIKEVIENNIPRIDYTGGGCGKLLLEPQRTNLALYSEQFDNAYWNVNSNAVRTLSTNLSPDGTLNAYKIEAVANTQVGALGTTTIGTVITHSLYVRRISGSTTFNMVDVNNVSTLVNITSEWQRFSVTATATSTNLRNYFRLASVGDVVEVYGIQAEIGSYPTSYIKTLVSSVTRLADAAYKTGISSLINSVEGVLFINTSTPINDSNAGVISVSDGTLSNRCILFYGVGNISARLTVGGVNSVPLSKTFVTSDYHKIAARWNATTFDLYVDGVFVSSTANSSFSTNTLTSLQFNAGSGANNFLGNAQSVQVLSYLTDTQMVSLTTL